MASKPWTEPELDELRAHAADDSWLVKLSPTLLDRSYASLRIQMTAVRRSLGITMRRGPRSEDDWQDRVVLASKQLAERTLRVGMWS
jgi:hypothetical protein